MGVASDVECVRYRRGELTSATVRVYDTPVHVRFKRVESARSKDGALQMTLLAGRSKKLFAVTSYSSPAIKHGMRPTDLVLQALSALENYFTCGQS